MIKNVNGVDVEMTADEIAAFEASRAPAAPVIEDYQRAIQTLIDQAAASQQYADGVTLASYANSTIDDWKAQAETFIAWRDQVWSYAYGELAKVQNGTRTQPSVDKLLGELPKIAW